MTDDEPSGKLARLPGLGPIEWNDFPKAYRLRSVGREGPDEPWIWFLELDHPHGYDAASDIVFIRLSRHESMASPVVRRPGETWWFSDERKAKDYAHRLRFEASRLNDHLLGTDGGFYVRD